MAELQSQSLAVSDDGESLSAARELSSQPKWEVELFSPDKHGTEILTWWRGWGRKAPTLEMVSNAGYIVTIDGVPAACAWAHYGNSRTGHIGYPCTNPQVGRRKRLHALDVAIRCAEKFLKSVGMQAVVVNVDNPALTKMLNQNGFDILTKHDFLHKKLS